MKHLWLIVILALSLITTSAHAAPPYPLQVDATETTMTVTLSGATEIAGQNVFVLAQTEQFSTSAVSISQGLGGIVSFIDEYSLIPFPANRVRTVRPDGTAVWKFASLSNKQYYVRVYSYNPSSPNQITLVTETKTLTTPAIRTFEAQWPLRVETSGQIAVFSGKVDTSKYATMAGIRIELQYASVPFPVTTPPSGALPANAYKVDSTLTRDGTLTGVSPDGTYYFKLGGLTPKQLYYFRQVVTIQGALVDIQGDQFYAGETYTPAGTSDALDAENKRTYNLLAPWPGLSKLYDPDLCYQKKYIEKSIPENSICDINGFISFAFRLIISLTAVMLVLRLVYEGYQYMMTDVPFLRASAKSNFASALVGLLIALSAYVILNTINPKLVSNNISIDQVSVGVEEVWDRANDADFMARLDSLSTAGVTANLQDPTFLAYLAHQQGAGGVKIILKAATTNTAVPQNIYKNMSTNFNLRDAQKTIGTSTLTPINFLNYWSIKVGAFKKNPRGNIPDFINNQLIRVSQETGVDLVTLQVMCRIESGCNNQEAVTVVNKYGYAGLFQLSNQEHRSKVSGKFNGRVWETYKKPDGILLDAFHNAYAGAKFMKENLSQIKK